MKVTQLGTWGFFQCHIVSARYPLPYTHGADNKIPYITHRFWGSTHNTFLEDFIRSRLPRTQEQHSHHQPSGHQCIGGMAIVMCQGFCQELPCLPQERVRSDIQFKATHGGKSLTLVHVGYFVIKVLCNEVKEDTWQSLLWFDSIPNIVEAIAVPNKSF